MVTSQKILDPDTVPGLCWRIADRFGVPSLALLAMIVVIGYLGKVLVEKVFVPMGEAVSTNLKTQTTQLEKQSAQMMEQTALLRVVAAQSEDTADFRIATNEHHRASAILMQAIRDGQVRLEEQNRQLIIEMKTVGDGIRAILGNPTTQAKPSGGTG
jgi:hypothetical protein